MGDLIKYLYSQFIMRDVLSFITPGAIVIFTAVFLFYPQILSHYVPWPLYIPLFGVFYIVGFAVQCLGELFGIIRFYSNADKSSWHQRFSIFGCNWASESNIWWKKAHEMYAVFREATKTEHGAQQAHERMIVLKQMCGNGFLASVIAGSFLIFDYLPFLVKLWWGIFVAFLLIVSLFWGHRVHVLRQDSIAETILSSLKKDEGTNDKKDGITK